MNGNRIGHTGGTGSPAFSVRRSTRRWLVVGGTHGVLALGSLIMVLPLLWAISTSLKDQTSAFAFPPQLFPHPVDWANYQTLFTTLPVGTFLTNSIKVAIIATVGQVLTCSMAGFAFARLRFPGRQLLFVLLLITLMVPTQVTLVPSFFVMRWLGWIDTLRSLTVPYWTGGALGTFLARQFFLTVPDELMEAATLDGAGYWRIYVGIFMPLALPVLATIGILTFLASWNNLLSPLIFISSEANMTLTLGLTLLQGQYLTPWPLVMAGALISVVPPMVVFLVAQRYLVEGVARTGLKG